MPLSALPVALLVCLDLQQEPTQTFSSKSLNVSIGLEGGGLLC